MPAPAGEYFEVTPSDPDNIFSAQVYLNLEDFPNVGGAVRVQPPVHIEQAFLDRRSKDIGVGLEAIAHSEEALLLDLELDAERKVRKDDDSDFMTAKEMAEHTVRDVLDTLGALATQEAFKRTAHNF